MISTPSGLLSLIIFGSTVYRECDAAIWRNMEEDSEQSKENNEKLVNSIVRQLDFLIQQPSILTTLRDSGLLKITDLQSAELTSAISSVDLDQLNSYLLEHPDLLKMMTSILDNGGLMDAAQTPNMRDSTSTETSSFEIDIGKLRSLMQQQPKFLDTLIAVLKSNEKLQSTGIYQRERVRRDVNATHNNVSDSANNPVNRSLHRQESKLEDEEQYRRDELNQQNLTVQEERVHQSLDHHRGRDEKLNQTESAASCTDEESIELEILSDDTTQVQMMETILDQLDEVRDLCIDVLEGRLSDAILVNQPMVDDLGEICTAILEKTDNMILVEVEENHEK